MSWQAGTMLHPGAQRSEHRTSTAARRMDRRAAVDTAKRQSGRQLGAWSRHHPGASLPLARRHYSSSTTCCQKNLITLSTFRGEDHLRFELTENMPWRLEMKASGRAEARLYDETLTVTFAGEEGGVVPVDTNAYWGSDFRWPTTAPLHGYVKELRYRNYRHQADGQNVRHVSGSREARYVSRVDNGKGQYLYGKLIGDIHFDNSVHLKNCKSQKVEFFYTLNGATGKFGLENNYYKNLYGNLRRTQWLSGDN